LSTGSSLPGIERTDAIPAATASAGTASSSAPATAAMMLDTLCAPISRECSGRRPAGVASSIETPSHVISISSGKISRDRENPKVRAEGISCASRSP